MGYRRILIEEKEKQEILSKYYSQNNVVSEQFDNAKGIYKTIKQQVLNVRSGQSLEPKYLTIPTQTTIWPDLTKGRIVINQAIRSDNKLKVYNKLTISCNSSVVLYDESKPYGEGTSFVTYIKSIFCNGNKLKTWDELTKSKKTDNKLKQPKTIRLNPTEEQQCELLGDKVWSYAKKGKQWFASKDRINWYDITNNKVAVNKLVAGCKNIKDLLAFTPPPVTDWEGEDPVNWDNKNPDGIGSSQTGSKTNIAPDQDNEERPY